MNNTVAAIASLTAPLALAATLDPWRAASEREIVSALEAACVSRPGTAARAKQEQRVAEARESEAGVWVNVAESIRARLTRHVADGGDAVGALRRALGGRVAAGLRPAVEGLAALAHEDAKRLRTARAVVAAFRTAGYRGSECLHVSEITVGGSGPVEARGASGGHTDWSRGASKPRWVAGDPQFAVRVASDWQASVETPGLAVVDGQVTLSVDCVSVIDGMVVGRAHVVSQAAGYGLIVEQCWVAVRGSLGAHGDDSEAAIQRLLRRERAAAREAAFAAGDRTEAERAEKRRERAVAALGPDTAEALAASALSITALENLSRGRGVVVRFEHSLAAGNCAIGSRDFVARHFAGRESATVAEVLAEGVRDRLRYAAAACLAAIRADRAA
jgi:hypothetical protein